MIHIDKLRNQLTSQCWTTMQSFLLVEATYIRRRDVQQDFSSNSPQSSITSISSINGKMKLLSEFLSGISGSGRVRKQTIKYEDFEMTFQLWKQQANILMEEYQRKIILPRRKPHTMWSTVTKLTEKEVFKDSVDDGMSKTIFYLKTPIKTEEFSYLIYAETSSLINDQESNSPPEVILPHLMYPEMDDDDLAARKIEIKIEQNDEFDDVISRSHVEPSGDFEDIEPMNETLKMEIKIEPNDEFGDKNSSSHDVVKREINIDSVTLDDGGIPINVYPAEKERVNKRPWIVTDFYELNRLENERQQRKKVEEEKMKKQRSAQQKLRRAKQTESHKKAFRIKDADRKRLKRAAETEEESLERKKKDALRKKLRRLKMDADERDRQRVRNAQQKRDRRLKMDEDELNRQRDAQQKIDRCLQMKCDKEN
uniref:Uncharacterized protein n=1 Tax=Strigamia maritima TaxID=126957 RepID=T1INM8_STRMM